MYNEVLNLETRSWGGGGTPPPQTPQKTSLYVPFLSPKTKQKHGMPKKGPLAHCKLESNQNPTAIVKMTPKKTKEQTHNPFFAQIIRLLLFFRMTNSGEDDPTDHPRAKK